MNEFSTFLILVVLFISVPLLVSYIKGDWSKKRGN